MKNNRRLRVSVKVKFILCYSEFAPTVPWCNMLQIWAVKKIQMNNLKYREIRTKKNSEFEHFSCRRKSEDVMKHPRISHWLLPQLHPNISTNYLLKEEEKIDIDITKTRVSSFPFTINRVD